MMKACRWAEKKVKFVKSIYSLSPVLVGVLWNVLFLNVCRSTTICLCRYSARFAFLFSCLLSDLFHIIYCLCEGGGNVINCLLGKGLTRAERCLRDPAGLSCSNAHLPLVLLKHSGLKGDTFWENKLLSNDLGKN